MSQQVDLARRNFLTARHERTSISDVAQTFRLDVSENCLPYRNVVCEACRDTCEPNAIRFPPRLGGAARPVIDLQSCTGCGECVGACPVAAIRLEKIAGDNESQGAIGD